MSEMRGAESDDLKSGPVEGFDGPFGTGYRCSTCAVTIEGASELLEKHREWHKQLEAS